MGYFKNTAEGGTAGGNVSVANSGGVSGTAFDSIIVASAAVNAGNAAIKYSSSAAFQGLLGYSIVPQASTSYLRWTDPTPGPRGGVRRSYTRTGTTSAQTELASIRSQGGGPLGDSAGAGMAAIMVTTTGALAANTAGVTHAASLYTPPVDTPVQVEIFAEKGTTTTDGKTWFRVYSADGATVLHSWSATNVNTRSSDAWQYRFGGVTTTSGWTEDRLDSLQAGTLASGFFSQLPEESRILSVDISGTGEPFSTATVVPTLEPGSPAPDSWTFTQVSGSPVVLSGSGSTRTFTTPAVPPPGDTVVIDVTATKAGVSNTKSGSIAVLPHTFWWSDFGSEYLPVEFL